LHQDTQKMIDKVEQRTGYKVSVGSGSDFSGYAQMITATPQNPIHVINVNQNYSHIGDYVVALQCAMILAKWTDPKKIPNFVVNEEKANYQIDKCANNKKLASIPSDTAQQFAKTIVKGLIHQLLSLPIEMIAIDICRKECPNLNNIMKTALNNEIQELHQSLEPRIKQMTPEDIFEKNAAMNAAFTLNWSRISGDEHILVPFKTVEVLDKGRELLKVYDDIAKTDAQRYTKIVDGWADKLKMNTLYTWKFRDETNDA